MIEYLTAADYAGRTLKPGGEPHRVLYEDSKAFRDLLGRLLYDVLVAPAWSMGVGSEMFVEFEISEPMEDFVQ